MFVGSLQVRIPVPARFFNQECLLKTAHNYIWLFQIVNITSEMLEVLPLSYLNVRDAPVSINLNS